MNKPILPHEIRKAFEGRVFSVTVESVTLPKGHRVDVEVVRHPPSVVLIPMDGDGEVILVRQYRHSLGRYLWELPAGTLKPGEDPVKAAERECHEEIGLIPSKLERLGAFFPTPGYCDEEMIFYRASGLRERGEGDEDAQPDEDEDIEPRPFSLDDLERMIDNGEIIDLKTVAGISLLRR